MSSSLLVYSFVSTLGFVPYVIFLSALFSGSKQQKSGKSGKHKENDQRIQAGRMKTKLRMEFEN